jgi:hypothetical protein
VARYVINPGSMAQRIFSSVAEMVQTGLVSSADFKIMPQFIEGETLGPKLVPVQA